MLKEHQVNTLRHGDVFRDWLIHLLGDRIHDKRCDVAVYKIEPASHTVCRYEFLGENYSVVAKFYAEPSSWKKDYDPKKSMEKEFRNLERVKKIIEVPEPLAVKAKFNCVLVTEHIRGRPLYAYMRDEEDLYDKLTAVAHLLRKLHDGTKSDYRKQDEFSQFHKTLDQLSLGKTARDNFNRLLGDWWYSTLVDHHHGCLIHHDANPVNYIFGNDKAYALDFESARDHAHPVHDLGIMAAELKHYFAMHKRDGGRAEPYIGHFLWHYSRDLGEFRRITRALPFFMSLGLLRINRLHIDPDQGAYILREATACLKAVDSK